MNGEGQISSVGGFPLGSIVSTPNALERLTEDDILQALSRHVRGDWGDLGVEDKTANDAAVRNGTRLFSAYLSASGVKFWVITEADRSVTTILLPEDY